MSMKGIRRRRGPDSKGWPFRWCGPQPPPDGCSWPSVCDRCDVTCDGKGKHAHSQPGRVFIPAPQEDLPYVPDADDDDLVYVPDEQEIRQNPELGTPPESAG